MSGEIILYTTEDGGTQISLKEIEGTVWLTQAEMADLFQATKQNISLHIKNILAEGEQDPNSVVKEYLTTATDGKEYKVLHYALPIILAVGFRVRSPRGTQFRRWAADKLSEFLVKGFVMDDAKLKDPDSDYFEELLARIRDIRASEKLFYKKVLDIYALSVDYDPKSETSEKFFQTVQNKMHWAAHGHTAAEIVVIRADPNKENAGMTTWANASKGGLPNKRDAIIAKNYLNDEELETLNRIVTAYLEFAELQARSRKTMTMADWISKLDDFLKLSDREILTGGGRISAKLAKEKGEAAFDEWKQKQLNAPSAVEVHFNEAIGKTKSLEAVKLKPKGNKND
jgi:hypothetical protein